jgi:hypothetical protein
VKLQYEIKKGARRAVEAFPEKTGDCEVGAGTIAYSAATERRLLPY